MTMGKSGTRRTRTRSRTRLIPVTREAPDRRSRRLQKEGSIRTYVFFPKHGRFYECQVMEMSQNACKTVRKRF